MEAHKMTIQILTIEFGNVPNLNDLDKMNLVYCYFVSYFELKLVRSRAHTTGSRNQVKEMGHDHRRHNQNQVNGKEHACRVCSYSVPSS